MDSPKGEEPKKGKGKEDLVAKYRVRIEEEFSGKLATSKKEGMYSANYINFKNELMPKQFSVYENLCNKSERILKIAPEHAGC